MAPVFSRIAGASVALLALVGGADAFWRLPCQGRSGLARIDPLVNPGAVAPHAHTIHGGSNFGMNSGYEELVKSNCTSCAVRQDRSAYWTPVLYFKHADGKLQLVRQNGGTLVYYLLPKSGKVTAFPAGFEMIAGDTYRRNSSLPWPDPELSSWPADPEQSSQDALSQKALGFNCLNYGGKAEDSLYRHKMPSKADLDSKCKSGLRMELMFPSCWNGKDVRSADHKSHVAYPGLVKDGKCPQGFETQLIRLFFETIWDTQDFAGKAGEFVLSNGDTTGHGYHGDFVSGWDPAFLQKAADTCTHDSGNIKDCPLFTDLQSEAEQAQCQIEMPAELQKENCEKPKDGLPGGVQIQYGPQPATPAAGSAGSAPTSPAAAAPSYVASSSASSSASSGASSGAPASPYRPSQSAYPAKALELEGVVKNFVASDPPAEAPVPTTPAEVAHAAPTAVGEERSTTTWTSGNAVYELVVVKTSVTVTEGGAAATPTPEQSGSPSGAYRKRHLDAHRHQHAYFHGQRR
ncbi:MAG: hypothetical protein M1832_004474 [Thelocarpon impressellum]|nr:MAG: hypothetical protein M1832_004474 [Thelocarpon impressellum]